MATSYLVMLSEWNICVSGWFVGNTFVTFFTVKERNNKSLLGKIYLLLRVNWIMDNISTGLGKSTHSPILTRPLIILVRKTKTVSLLGCFKPKMISIDICLGIIQQLFWSGVVSFLICSDAIQRPFKRQILLATVSGHISRICKRHFLRIDSPHIWH